MWSQCVWLMNRWMVRARPRNSWARARPSSRMPVPASKIRMFCAGPELDARRVAAVERRRGPRGRDRSARAPEPRGEPGGGPIGPETLHTGHELVGVEGLHHVVVGTHLPRAVDVRLVRLRRDHDHDRARQLRIRAQAPEHLEAVNVVHDDVADDDPGPVGLRERDPLAALPGGEDREAAAPEDEGQELQEAVVVVDDEQGLARWRGGAGGRRRAGARHGVGGRTRSGRRAMVDASSSGSTSFGRGFRKPAAGARIRSSGVTLAVSAAGTRPPRSRGRARTRWMSAWPSSPGIPMSDTSTSGVHCARRLRAPPAGVRQGNDAVRGNHHHDATADGEAQDAGRQRGRTALILVAQAPVPPGRAAGAG